MIIGRIVSILQNRIAMALNVWVRFWMRRNRPASDITILSNNCLAGMVYHDFGLPFLSPTINLSMSCDAFLKICHDPRYYLSAPLYEKRLETVTGGANRETQRCPMGILGEGTRGIELSFVHYKSFEEAKQAWERRCARVNWEKVVLIMTDNSGADATTLRDFAALPFEKKVVFVRHPEQLQDAAPVGFHVKGLTPERFELTAFMRWGWGRRYYHQFDFASWLK